LLRYEDFVRDPSAAVRRIRGWLGEPLGELPFLDGHSVRLGVSHTVAGNPNRLDTGRIQIQPDLEWASRMAFHDRALVTGLTWPLLKRYRYPLGAAAEAEPAAT
jgi:hypothetical protein